MIFTKLGRILAVLAIAFGVLRIVMAITVLFSEDPGSTARYLGSKTTGQAIDQGLYTIVFGILVGVLTDVTTIDSSHRKAFFHTSSQL
ncbi:hypothetical protein [Ruegeria sp. EL01]|jgi:hypothetical protein|uniref:hypothetical protein n=1 Tax=Ruegeria sp. EL01 TaxID=2107578 RepID=UPI000EA81643|nr:hypothetical protein [Ruegeria sp. EL01]